MSFTVPIPPPAHSFIIGLAVINTHTQIQDQYMTELQRVNALYQDQSNQWLQLLRKHAQQDRPVTIWECTLHHDAVQHKARSLFGAFRATPFAFQPGIFTLKDLRILRCHLWPAKETSFTRRSVPVQFDGVRCWLKRLYSDWIDNLVKGNRNAVASVSRQCWPVLFCIRAPFF